jgi:Domain of unknown function (DUF4412)
LKLKLCVVALIAVALLPAAAQIPHLTPFSGDVQITSEHGARAGQETNGKLYVAREQMRFEMESGPRGAATIITNFPTKTTDVLMTEQHMYMEFTADQQAMARRPGMASQIKPFSDPSNPCANDTSSTCKKVGVEEVSGRTCDHWQITDKEGRVTNAWIDQKLHFPIKEVTPDTTWQVTNIKEGEQPASLFEIPPGYQKMDLGQMMQGRGRPQ